MKNLLNNFINSFEHVQLFDAIEFAKKFNNVFDENYIELD